MRAFSQRLLPPYSGFVQIAESAHARAQSFDGINWEIQYLSGDKQTNEQKYQVQGYGLDRGYYRVGSLNNHELRTFTFPSCVNHDQVSESIHELTEFLSTAQVPFPAGDIYEYWLLDGADDSPLALINTCCDESLMDKYSGQTEWTAIPSSKMKVESTAHEQARNEPPVNHRFECLIANRAGKNPRTAWFKRDRYQNDDFPALLVREDWPEQAHHDLCQRYLMRKAPRLLMLQGLPENVRGRLEVAAKKHVLEVDDYFPMYPEVNDHDLMNAIRVEARLRRIAPQASTTSKQEKSSTVTPLSKDMRIIEN